MNFEFSEDQNSVITALDSILAPFEACPVEPVAYSYSLDIEQTLRDSGFLAIAGEEGFSCLDGAIVVERVARVPHVVESAASILIAPFLPLELGAAPIAICCATDNSPVRFLPKAQTLLVLQDDHVKILAIETADVSPTESLLGYPYGRLKPGFGTEVGKYDDLELLRRRWQIGLAAEAAGCMSSALKLVITHVTDRFAFGRPLGSLQAIQHRLAMAAETAEAVKWLAFRAAWSDTAADAAIAAGFAQSRIAQFTYDLHQFSGAMGLTLEFPLHFWTYRLRALAGELGGASAQARKAASAVWGVAA